MADELISRLELDHAVLELPYRRLHMQAHRRTGVAMPARIRFKRSDPRWTTH